ncbi:MAG TPA: VOC family protein [Bacteroidales bacterium]|nr:VOC family protein [Bacteroidales bacterium]HPS63292.1 VOC family protein [Bacteroidales bacterium]
MRIDHIAVWTCDLETMRTFYVAHFGANAGALYHNPVTGLRTCFLAFDDGCRLELMHLPGMAARKQDGSIPEQGYTHFSVSVGSRATVDSLTEQLRQAGCRIAGEPRVTGDGYYESVVLDPEGNRVEITV